MGENGLNDFEDVKGHSKGILGRLSSRAKKAIGITFFGLLSVGLNVYSIHKVFTYDKLLNNKINETSQLEDKLSSTKSLLGEARTNEGNARGEVNSLADELYKLKEANREKTVYSFETPVGGTNGQEFWKMVSLTSKGSLILPNGKKFPVGEYVLGEVIPAINRGEINIEFKNLEAFIGFKKVLDSLEYNVTKLNYSTDDMKAIEGMFNKNEIYKK